MTIHLGCQPPQLWLSSPTSGPARFDLVGGRSDSLPDLFKIIIRICFNVGFVLRWVYSHTGEALHAVLDRELGLVVGLEGLGFTDCYLGG